MKWINTCEKSFPEVGSHDKLNVKFNGSPDVIQYINKKWWWFNEDNHLKYPVNKNSLHAIEWLDESEPEEKKYTEEERDNFACAFLVFASCDPRAQALNDANTPPGKILDFYKDRAFIDPDTSKQ